LGKKIQTNAIAPKAWRINFQFICMTMTTGTDTFKSRDLPTPIRRCLAWLPMAILLWSCQSGPAEKSPIRTLVMTTDLVDDPDVIHYYDSMHSSKGVWPGLEKANRAAGIRSVRIWRYGTRLMMMLEVPAGADMARMDSLYVSADPSVKEWGVMMSRFQRSLPGVDTTQKWVSMDIIHDYEDGKYLK
jgi:L-rhamnose mutarotase